MCKSKIQAASPSQPHARARPVQKEPRALVHSFLGQVLVPSISAFPRGPSGWASLAF